MFLLEVYYRPPRHQERESKITEFVHNQGGWLKGREPAPGAGEGVERLFFEFPEREAAEEALSVLRLQGEHVDGPVDSTPTVLD
jgi:hypothetical protein